MWWPPRFLYYRLYSKNGNESLLGESRRQPPLVILVLVRDGYWWPSQADHSRSCPYAYFNNKQSINGAGKKVIKKSTGLEPIRRNFSRAPSIIVERYGSAVAGADGR